MSRVAAAILGLVLPAVALSTCATAPASRKSQTQKDCIKTREINVISPLDDRHVFVRLGSHRSYLLTMDSRCPGLHRARQLTIADSASRVCPNGTSLLAFEEPSLGAMRCRIAQIQSVASKDAALDLIHAEVPPQ